MNKRPITIRKWWKRNCLNVALVGVILGSMTIGYVAGILSPFECTTWEQTEQRTFGRKELIPPLIQEM